MKAVLGVEETLQLARGALLDAVALDYSKADVAALFRSLTPAMFYKAMTSYANHREWQDVYHVPSRGRVLYVKIVDDRIAEFRVLSFKERDQ